MIRTQQQLQQLFQQRKAINERKKQREKQKYQKAKEAIKKELQQQKTKIIQKQTSTNKQGLTIIKYSTRITIYNSNQFEREIPEENLYSLYELQHIEELYPEEEGRINWKLWHKLIRKLRKNL